MDGDRLPLDFVCVGPKRTGTTWIDAYLRASERVYLPTGTKETFYFDRHHPRGRDWYLSLFDLPDPLPPGTRVGEVSPSYFPHPDAADRLREASPGCRVIVTLRDPERRLVSAYHHHRQSGTFSPEVSLAEALEAHPFLLDEARYATHLRSWRERFESVHVLFLEDLEADPDGFCAGLCRAIDLDPVPPIPDELRTRVGGGELPRSFRLSSLARRTAARLRDRNLFGLVRLGGRLGLRRLLMGGRPLPGSEPEIPEWARQVLHEETAGLAELGVRVPTSDL